MKNFSKSSPRPMWSSKVQSLCWIGSKLILLPLILCLATAGCIRSRVEYRLAKAVRDPVETKGYIRLVNGPVTVAVIGQEESPVGTLNPDKKKYQVLVDGKVKSLDMTGCLILWEQDVAAFVRGEKRLQMLEADPDIAKIIKAKGL